MKLQVSYFPLYFELLTFFSLHLQSFSSAIILLFHRLASSFRSLKLGTLEASSSFPSWLFSLESQLLLSSRTLQIFSCLHSRNAHSALNSSGIVSESSCSSTEPDSWDLSTRICWMNGKQQKQPCHFSWWALILFWMTQWRNRLCLLEPPGATRAHL